MILLLLLLPAIVSSQDSQYGQYQNGQYVQSSEYRMMSGSTGGYPSQPQYNPPNSPNQQQNLYGQSNGQYQQSTQNPNQNQFGTNPQYQPTQYSSSTLQYNQPAQEIPMGQNAQFDQYGRPMNQQGPNAQFDQSQQSSLPSEPIYDADGNVINGYAGPAQNNQNGQFQSSTQNPYQNQDSNQFNQNQPPNQFNQNQPPNQFNQNQQYQSTQTGGMNQNGQQWMQNPNGVSNGNSAQLTQYSFNNGQCVYQNGQVVENGVSRPLNQTEQQQLIQFEQALTQYGRALSASMGSFVQTLLSWNPQSQSFPNLTSSSPQMPSLPCFCSQSSCQAGQVQNSQYSQQFIGPLQTGNSPQFDQNNNQYQNQQIQNQNQFQNNQYQTNQYQPQNNQYQANQYQSQNNQYQNSQFQNSNQYQNQPNQNSQYQSNAYGGRR